MAHRDTIAEIEEIVNRETRAWNTQDVDLLMTVFHHDMVWAWPPTAQDHDPLDWVLKWGHYDEIRWREGWQALFDTHELIHNVRTLCKILISEEGDGAFAVVDVDTLWRDSAGHEQHWKGRASKTYTRVGDTWKLIAHTGILAY